MDKQLEELMERLRRLEDREAVRTVIAAVETLRDGGPNEVDELMKCMTEDVHFLWSLEKIEVAGRDKLRDYIRKGRGTRVWTRHVFTNLQVQVKGDRAEATWYVMAEGVSGVEAAAVGDKQARQREPANPDTLVHSDTKGAKRAVLVRTKDGWKISDYRTDMVRLSAETLKFR
ncbi:MAG: nuclear transport factor 2 family protein [Thaumarchaeota archaeon]|nr:nuclear transport factor 2 family protein [Nitrososphaerota archaeon]